MQKNSGKSEKKRVSGIIQLNRRGTGYLAWPMDEKAATKKEKDDIEIQNTSLRGALNGDEVEVELVGLSKGWRGAPERWQGKVVKIVARAREQFVCIIKDGMAVPDDIKFYKPIAIKGAEFADGEKVLVQLEHFDGSAARGHVLEHLGRAGEHRVEMNAIVLEHGFRTQFPMEALGEAREIERTHAETIAKELAPASGRADFRDTPTFTVDPPDAKDFDDALSIEALPDGTFEVGVHIADATFFCRPGTAIDTEAKRRGTSVYLVDATIPMLPHELSADVCSLQEGEDRLAFSAVFRLNDRAEVLSRKFTKSVIRSNKRFTYEEAQKILTAAAGPYVQELSQLRQLARVLKAGREQEGAIDFGDHEVRFELDNTGAPLKVVRKERLETMQMIEEFMLLANREVAKYISDLAKKVPESGYVFLYRIHDDPKQDRIEELATFVRAVGYDFGHANKKHRYSARDIAHLLAQIKGKPEEHLIRTATLRSMAKAMYSTKNIGHFGLAFKDYTHFTSPIRRYPDMLAHRILESHLNGKPITRREYVDLEKMCIAASEQEAKATDAERESIRYKLVEYMLPKIGQTFDAVISGVTDWGLYVEEKESTAEGLVRVATMGGLPGQGDFYNYVPKDYSLVGQRSKKKFSLGDPVRIKLVAADLAARQLDFELAK